MGGAQSFLGSIGVSLFANSLVFGQSIAPVVEALIPASAQHKTETSSFQFEVIGVKGTARTFEVAALAPPPAAAPAATDATNANAMIGPVIVVPAAIASTNKAVA